MNPDKNQLLFESMRQEMMTGPTSLDVIWLLLGLVALLLLVRFAARWSARTGKPKERPSIDFLSAGIDAIGLDELDRRELLRLATTAQLPQPAAVLLSPANLAGLVRHPANQPVTPETMSRMQRLSRRLFGCPLPSATTGAASATSSGKRPRPVQPA